MACTCGRSPTGLCIGWHNLTEEKYLEKEQKDKKMLEEKLRKKYPALKNAYNHYQNIKRMCESKERKKD